MNPFFASLSAMLVLGTVITPANALSLGDIITQTSHTSNATNKVICGAKVGDLHFKVTNLVLTKSLYLPHALKPHTISPEDNRLIVLIEGRAVNIGSEKASFTCPQLVAANGGKHESIDRFYYKRSGSTSLNPMECYPFVACYLISPQLLKNSKLLFTDGQWFEPKSATVAIPIDNNTALESTYTLRQVTDNMFDVEKIPNPIDESVSDEVAQARQAAEEQKAQKEAEERMEEWKLRMAEAEFNNQLNRLEAASRELENELRNLDREAEAAERELENELRRLENSSDFDIDY